MDLRALVKRKLLLAVITGTVLIGSGLAAFVLQARNNSATVAGQVKSNATTKAADSKPEQLPQEEKARQDAGDNIQTGSVNQAANPSPATPDRPVGSSPTPPAAKPRISAPTPPTPTVPTVKQIKQVTLTANTQLTPGCGAPVFPYRYDITFHYAQTGTILTAKWDLDTPDGQPLPYPIKPVLQGYQIDSSTVSMYDNISGERGGIPSNGTFGYRVRLYVSGTGGTNGVYSNWISVPKAVCIPY